jgi:nucleoside-diphosphate-sugar epimerase
VIVAITGATGFVGQALLDAAASQGVKLRALARSPQDKRKGVTWVAGDLADHKALAKLVKGAGAVIHVAGVVNTPDPAVFEAGNVAGTLAVLEAALAAGVPRFVHVSSLSAREPKLSAYGASKARAERLVKSSAIDWTIVRPPTIYGPRDKDVFELFRSAKWGVIPMPDEGRQSVIHVDDLARLLLTLVPGGEAATHRTFEPDDGRPGGWTHYELARAIGWAMGRRPFVVGLSKRSLEWAAKADKALRGTKAKLTLDRVGYMTHPDWAVRKEARVPVSLWQAAIETREGLKATARWYREQRWL